MPHAIGYGTLLLRESLGKTIGEARAEQCELIPVRVRDYRRLYNYSPPHYRPVFKVTGEPVERSAANVEPAEGAWFSAVAFEVTVEELAALDARERGYDRVEIPLEHFESGEMFGLGIFYMCPGDAPLICRDPALMLPRWLDLHFARAGSYLISDTFGQAFDASTFLADGMTPVMERYEEWDVELRRI